jgi:hypothetical protein
MAAILKPYRANQGPFIGRAPTFHHSIEILRLACHSFISGPRKLIRNGGAVNKDMFKVVLYSFLWVLGARLAFCDQVPEVVGVIGHYHLESFCSAQVFVSSNNSVNVNVNINLEGSITIPSQLSGFPTSVIQQGNCVLLFA